MFGWQWLTVGNVLTFAGVVSGVLGLVLVYRQVRAAAVQAQQTATAQRGRFVLDVINRYFDDTEMLRMYALTDSERVAAAFEPPLTNKDEDALSRTLYYFDTLAFLVNNKLIVLQDVAILRYRIAAFFDNPHIDKALQQRYSPGRRLDGLSVQEAHPLAYGLYKQLQALPISLEGIDQPPS